MLDNRWIVPYNAYMLARYNCHINVECCVSVAANKYITKYTHKGSDRATVSVTDGDEIQPWLFVTDDRGASRAGLSYKR